MASTQPDSASSAAAADFTKTWRYRAGLALFVFGNVVWFLALIVPFAGFGIGLVGALFIAGEVIMLVSIVFLGMEGFKALKAKVFGAAKAGFVGPVGPVRHYIGIVLISLGVPAVWAVGLLAWQSSIEVTPDNPFPEIWGLDWRQQISLAIGLIVGGQIAFVVGIYVLGAPWWERFRNLIIWQRPAE